MLGLPLYLAILSAPSWDLWGPLGDLSTTSSSSAWGWGRGEEEE